MFGEASEGEGVADPLVGLLGRFFATRSRILLIRAASLNFGEEFTDGGGVQWRINFNRYWWICLWYAALIKLIRIVSLPIGQDSSMNLLQRLVLLCYNLVHLCFVSITKRLVIVMFYGQNPEVVLADCLYSLLHVQRQFQAG